VKKDDGYVAIKRFWEHHYTFFSYVHNHTVCEGAQWKEKYGARYSLDEWKRDMVSKSFLEKNHLPVSDGYFEMSDGKVVERPIFEYVRDHFGYRLELRDAVFPASAKIGKPFKAVLRLVNRGFAAPINPRPVYLVLLSEGKPVILAEAKCDVRTWYPCDPADRIHLAPTRVLNFTVQKFPSLPSGEYNLGLWMPDPAESIKNDARYAIRLANRDVSWWDAGHDKYGINLIGKLEL
jgi:hypothetical protein